MVGGRIKRDDGLSAISSNNIFSALESRRRKPSKEKSDKSDSKIKHTKPGREVQVPSQVWTPTPVSVKSWADCEDDDDYFATAAPLPTWGSDQLPQITEHATEVLSNGEESESDEEAEEEVDEAEEETENELADLKVEVTSHKPVPVPTTAFREPDRQLSKKERKKKELAELEAVLAEFAADQKDTNDLAESRDEKHDVPNGEVNGKQNRESGLALTESKNAKRRKAKREKSSKEGKDDEVPLTVDMDGGPKDIEVMDIADALSVPADPKEVFKKLASLKKKKSSRDIDTAAKAAAAEASARAAKLAAAKKKEKSHYNQQPVR